MSKLISRISNKGRTDLGREGSRQEPRSVPYRSNPLCSKGGGGKSLREGTRVGNPAAGGVGVPITQRVGMMDELFVSRGSKGCKKKKRCTRKGVDPNGRWLSMITTFSIGMRLEPVSTVVLIFPKRTR